MDPDDARRSCLKNEPEVDLWFEGDSEPESARGTGWGRWRARYDDSTTATDNPPEGQPWVPGAGADSTTVPGPVPPGVPAADSTVPVPPGVVDSHSSR